MPTFECACGFTCGSARAWSRHQERNPDHELVDPSVLLQSCDTSVQHTNVDREPCKLRAPSSAVGAAGFRDALKGVGLALASAEHGQRALERSLSSWSKCAGTVAPPALKDKLASTLKHGALPVLVAAKHGDVDGLRACLQSGTEPGRVDAHDDVGLSPLAWAASRGHLECVETLIAAGSRLGAAAHTDGVAPLFLALSKGHAACATLLLEARAAVDEVEPLRGQTAQHAAAAAEPAVPLELLARVLHARVLAVSGEQVEGEAGVMEPEALDSDLDGFTALHIAAGRGSVQAVQLLLERAPAAEAARLSRSKGKVSPLGAACRRDRREVARLLLAAGAPLDAGALHLCATRGWLADLLCAAGEDAVDAEGVEGAEGTEGAESAEGAPGRAHLRRGEGGNGETCGEAPRAVDCAGADGVTALMLAAQAGEEQAVSELLAARANPSEADSERHSALMRASFYGHGRIVTALLAAGAAIDVPDAEGNTALHHAGRSGSSTYWNSSTEPIAPSKMPWAKCPQSRTNHAACSDSIEAVRAKVA